MANVNYSYFNLNWTSSWDNLPKPPKSSSLWGTASCAKTGSYPAAQAAAMAQHYVIWCPNTTLSQTSSIFNCPGSTVGIGTQTATNTRVYVYNNSTTTTGNVIGLRAYQASSANGTQVIYGGYFEASGIGQSSGFTYGGQIIGIYAKSIIGEGSTATGSNVLGQYVQAGAGTTSVVTGSISALTLNIKNQQVGNPSVFYTNNSTLLNLEPITGSNITSKFAIFQNGTGDQNYFAGYSGFGTIPNALNSIAAASISASCITSSYIQAPYFTRYTLNPHVAGTNIGTPGTTLYFGSDPNGTSNTVYSSASMLIPKSGTIKRVDAYCRVTVAASGASFITCSISGSTLYNHIGYFQANVTKLNTLSAKMNLPVSESMDFALRLDIPSNIGTSPQMRVSSVVYIE